MKNESIFTSLLTVLFIGLKLTGYINWSWWWVLSPIWGSFALALVIIVPLSMYKRKQERKLDALLKEIEKTRPPTRASKFQQRLDELMKKQSEN